MASPQEVEYSAEDGVVKMYLRGRPLNFYVHSEVQETYNPKTSAPPPSSKLELEWVYGYRGKDCRSNVYQLPSGETVYFVAAVVVLHNEESRTQRHYLEHDDDVKCMAVHPNDQIIATGQTAGHGIRDFREPHIRVWDSTSLETLHVIGKGEIVHSVSCLAFSKLDDGGLLVAVDESLSICVWDLTQGAEASKLTESKCSLDQVLAVEFSPVDPNTIVTCGKRSHIAFWNLEDKSLTKRVGVFENHDKPNIVTSIAYAEDGSVVSGDSNGNLIIWQKGHNTVQKMVKGAHTGVVFSILTQKDGSIVTAGRDGNIVEWTADFERTGNIIEIDEQDGKPRVVAAGGGDRLLVGTTRNCILEGTFSSATKLVMQGHTDELWGLAVHPIQHTFLTAGFDHSCFLWDTVTRRSVWTKNIGEEAQSATFSNNGEVVIIGTTSGSWFVMDAESQEVHSKHQDGEEAIQVVKFSPNGEYLAVASRDNYIYVYEVSDDCHEYKKIGKCKGHTSFVTHVDWSDDSKFLQSNSGDYELLFWNASECSHIVKSSEMCDVKWATNTCPLTFATFGIWPEGVDGTDVNTCAKTNQNQPSVLATGDDFAKVKIFRSPACYPKAQCRVYSGHSSHVTSVGFLHDDSRLISTGGKDTAVLQWVVSPATTTE